MTANPSPATPTSTADDTARAAGEAVPTTAPAAAFGQPAPAPAAAFGQPAPAPAPAPAAAASPLSAFLHPGGAKARSDPPPPDASPRLSAEIDRGGAKTHSDPEVGADRVFHHQHSVAARSQLRAAGMTDRQIARRVQRGLYRQVHGGVYRLATAPFTDHARLMAAVLAAGPDSLASHRAAGWLWGLTERPWVEVSIPNGRKCTAANVLIHRVRLPGTPSLRHGIPTTNPLRTLFDLAAVLPNDDALAEAFDRGIAAALFTPSAVHAELCRVRKPGRPGGPALERVLDGCGPVSLRSPSVLQNAFARLLRRAGLLDPVPEFEVLDGTYRIDHAYPHLHLGFELEGFEFHGSPRQAAADHARRRHLAALGWTILVFTSEDVRRRPDDVVAEVRREVMLRGRATSQPA